MKTKTTYQVENQRHGIIFDSPKLSSKKHVMDYIAVQKANEEGEPCKFRVNVIKTKSMSLKAWLNTEENNATT